MFKPLIIVGGTPEIANIVPSDAVTERIASGFEFTEGPVWANDGGLVFSDIPANKIYRWKPQEGVSVFRDANLRDDSIAQACAVLGPNGLTLDNRGRLTVCEHGNRRVSRFETDGSLAVLADHWRGRRLNSPNDLVWKSDGVLYFTDPPYGLPGRDQDPGKEIPFNGVYRVRDGEVELLHDGMSRPNGIAFSPDEKYLYVSNSDPEARYWKRFEVTADGRLGRDDVFFDATANRQDGNPDGLKLDCEGTLYCTGPGGIWLFSPEGRHLGTLCFPEVPANCQWGDEDARTLYVTARTSVYRVRLNAVGIRP